LKIEKDDGYASVVLSKILDRNIPERSRAFVTEIVNGVLRNQIYLDYIIDSVSKIKTEKMRPFIRQLLRISVYQIKFMDRVPNSAAVNEAIKLTKKRKFQRLSGFVNAVLREITRNEHIKLPYKQDDPALYLSVIYSFPLWITRYYIDRFGLEQAERICRAGLNTPKAHLCPNTLRTTIDKLADILGAEKTSGGLLAEHSDFTQSDAFKDGLFHVMDESSMRAVELLNPQPGETVLDLCAAPGGKSFYCSYLMQNSGRIISMDIHQHKLDKMNDSLNRLGINIVQTRLADARKVVPELVKQADRVLVDAPCTGLGVVRRKPDIKYAKQPEDIKRLAALQREILSAARRYVKPGGRLVYSTCTLTLEENDENAAWFTANNSFEQMASALFLPDEDWHYDGFFMSSFMRKENL
jgi:16S rRNA (cytosine967-C5)-methyltransferase